MLFVKYQEIVNILRVARKPIEPKNDKMVRLETRSILRRETKGTRMGELNEWWGLQFTHYR